MIKGPYKKIMRSASEEPGTSNPFRFAAPISVPAIGVYRIGQQCVIKKGHAS